MEEEQKKTPKHSSGVNILIRIDSLWRDTHTHSRAGLFSSWNEDLDRIWLELARDIKKDKFVTEETAFLKFDEELFKHGQIEDTPENGFSKLTELQIKNRDKQYKSLMKKQVFLARYENILGKGTTTRDDGDDDFD